MTTALWETFDLLCDLRRVLPHPGLVSLIPVYSAEPYVRVGFIRRDDWMGVPAGSPEAVLDIGLYRAMEERLGRSVRRAQHETLVHLRAYLYRVEPMVMVDWHPHDIRAGVTVRTCASDAPVDTLRPVVDRQGYMTFESTTGSVDVADISIPLADPDHETRCLAEVLGKYYQGWPPRGTRGSQ